MDFFAQFADLTMSFGSAANSVLQVAANTNDMGIVMTAGNDGGAEPERKVAKLALNAMMPSFF